MLGTLLCISDRIFVQFRILRSEHHCITLWSGSGTKFYFTLFLVYYECSITNKFSKFVKINFRKNVNHTLNTALFI